MSKPMFSKRHYEALAKAMSEAKPSPDRFSLGLGDDTVSQRGQWYTDVEQIVSMLIADNPKFDNDKFIKACGADT